MENFTTKESPKTPSINFEFQSGKLELRGRSIPENSVEFFKPLHNWVDSYISLDPKQTTIEMKLEYFNTSSSKCLLDLLKKFEVLSKSGKEVRVNWYYENNDRDMAEAGEDYQAIVKIPFNIIAVEEIL
jgi:hypothetical protein